jgi:peptidoglycan-associated lipoprotein
MTRGTRVLALSVLTLAMVAACRKKPEVASTPTPTPSPTCDQRCRDSIALAEKRRADSLAAAEEARRKAEYERAIASTRAALAAPVYFEYDSDELSADARATLDAKLPIFRANPGLRIRVAGHTDERGSDEYNLALGQRRAASVKRYLSDQGVDGGRIDLVSFGEERPAVTETSEEAWRMNRRAEFEITAGGDALVPGR